jgi:Family of unknown function (DUF6476)
LRALTVFVVVMGVILVVGFGAVIAVIAGRMSRNAPAASTEQHFSTSAIEIPRGARVEAMTTAPDRLILDLVLPNGERQVIVLDMSSGARLGTIELHPAQ